ncbi:MAG: SusE domain-containing protein [Bacteroidales bacterium]|nr:SusE domain-containing protein [Bacteroidales bacterium]MDD3009922.1 SusE domain-containing protein [Bacteroidales bacterium]HPE86168.1 SusE domain-containing protein [Bacteroidales bacterium]
MKKLSIILMFLAGLAVFSCTDEEVGPIIGDTVSPELTAPANGLSLLLTEENAEEEVLFTWTEADYGFSAAISYILEMDLAGNAFASPITLATLNNALTTTLTKGSLNSKLIAAGIAGGATVDVEFRVLSKVSNAVENLASVPLTTNVTTYLVIIDYPLLNVPGSYQGWNPEDNTTVLFSLNFDEKYEGYINFPDPNTEFKFAKGSWDENWGDTGADFTLDPGGDNIIIAEAGYYKFNADLNSLTYEYLKTDWGLIGSATPGGWDTDTDMIYDTDSGELSVTLNLVVGEIKFRANDAWDLDYGETDPPTGFLTKGGANIPISEDGNYTVTLVLNQANYTYRVMKN